MDIERVIAHLDMDAFYAAIEIRDDPALRGRPVIVGHRAPRGVVATCSYEARAFGVRSAMPAVTAVRRCPSAVWIPPRMEHYAETSRAIRMILGEACPAVEPVSIDEAFLDLTGLCRDLETGARLGAALKTRIRERFALTASVGIAPNKFLAKVASDLEKPDGLTVLSTDRVPELLWSLPITRLWGVGPKTAERLHARGYERIGDLARRPLSELARALGERLARHLHDLAHGRDHRSVTPHHEARSVSEERTYSEDLRDDDAIDRELLARSEGVARQLRRERLAARAVHIKVRTGDYETWTRTRTLPESTDLTEVIVETARHLFRERIRLEGRGVRLLGVGASGLIRSSVADGGLFPDPRRASARRAARAADAVRERHGEAAVIRARLLDTTRRARRDDDA